MDEQNEALSPTYWQDQLLERMMRAGWITQGAVIQVGLGASTILTTTEIGREKLLNLHALLDEIGLIKGPYRNGEVYALPGLLGAAIPHNLRPSGR